jgi:2-polyprenyl-6-methoxyphenol hydroxylase-like FAD-dependent oxidoreductase
MTNTDVVVIGAGPVGLAAALLLNGFGLRTVVLDRRTEPASHPKARGIRLRASELLNVWGFDAELRPAAMPDESHRFIYCESVAGEELARTAPAPPDASELASTLSYRVTQDTLERALDRRVREAPNVELRRGVEATAVRQDARGVEVDVVTADGTAEVVRATYALAADGAASGVRAGLGIRLGSGIPRGYWHSVLWRSDMTALVRDRPAIVFYTQAGGDALVGVGAAGTDGRWVTFVQLPPTAERPDPFGDDEALRITREAIGDPRHPVELLGTATFRIGADVADSYRDGRVFLVGDAAHVLPPTGGFGINTGFADVHDLVWKLAAVLRGDAPESLLDTYERERRPVALSNIAWSEANRERLIAMQAALREGDGAQLQSLVDEQGAHVSPLGQDLAFSYSGEGGDPAVLRRATAGARAPHARLGDGSIHALLEGRLTVLVGSAGAAMALREAVADRSGLIAVVDLGGLEDPAGHLRERYAAAFTGAVIVRPDGHVAHVSDEPFNVEPVLAAIDAVLAEGLAP